MKSISWLFLVTLGTVVGLFAFHGHGQVPSRVSPSHHNTPSSAPVSKINPANGLSTSRPQPLLRGTVLQAQTRSSDTAKQPESQPSALQKHPTRSGIVLRTGSGAIPPPSSPLPPANRPMPPLSPLSQQILSPPTFFWNQFFGMLIALGVVIVLIYLVLRWIAQQSGVRLPGNHQLFRVCDRISLEPKKGLWVIEVAGQYLVVATHEHGVTMLDKLDAHAVQEHIEGLEKPPVGGLWERLWQNKQNKQNKQSQPQASSEPPPISGQSSGSRSFESSGLETKESSTPSIPIHFEVVSDGQKATSTTPK